MACHIYSIVTDSDLRANTLITNPVHVTPYAGFNITHGPGPVK